MAGPFNCLIEATAGTDTSYYMATVEEDGFTYFNDSQFFRFQTPDNIHDIETQGQTITVTSGLQLWYVVRDVWVYTNLFDSLTLQMIHESDIDKQDLQTGLNTIVDYVNEVGSNAIAHNGQQLLNLYNAVLTMASELNAQGVTVTTPTSGSVYTTWTNKQYYTLQ